MFFTTRSYARQLRCGPFALSTHPSSSTQQNSPKQDKSVAPYPPRPPPSRRQATVAQLRRFPLEDHEDSPMTDASNLAEICTQTCGTEVRHNRNTV